jgi:flagellum-specific ATP synthase
MKTLTHACNRMVQSSLVERRGTVVKVTGILAESRGPHVAVGTPVAILGLYGEIPCQVVGFREDRILLMAFEDLQGVAPGAEVIAAQDKNGVGVSERLLGRIVDGMGVPMDGRPMPPFEECVPLFREAPSPVHRRRIESTLAVGVKAIDVFLPVGVGQRVAIMAGSGVGKSTLLGMIARNAMSDINIIALVGERGREVREFIEKDLGEEGLQRSIVVVATSDKSALLRLRAAYLATAYAEYFRSSGKRVLLMMDSVTRLAMAQREIGLSVGEPPSTKGYTPSVFSLLPKVLERAGLDDGDGSITGLYTVLVEGDDLNEPISDTVRGILDGHIVLDRGLAAKNHYPAIEILQSVSRVMPDITTEAERKIAACGREILSTYRRAEDLISIGAYQGGSDADIDFAVGHINELLKFLKQRPNEKFSRSESLLQLAQIVS